MSASDEIRHGHTKKGWLMNLSSSREMQIRFGNLSLLLGIMSVIWGCASLQFPANQPALNPLYTDNDLVVESKLFGMWTTENERESWIFHPSDDKRIAVTYMQNGSGECLPASFEAHLLRLGDSLYLDLFPGEIENAEQELGSDTYVFHLIPAHSFVKVRLEEDTVYLSMMDCERVHHLYKKKLLNIPHSSLEDGILLLASTEELQDFVMEHSEDAFCDPIALHRADSFPAAIE